MIQIRIFREQSKIRGFEVKGHADFAEEGSDIVCAAISALSLTGVFASERLCQLGRIKEPEKGHLIFNLPTDISKSLEQKAFTILETVIIGMYETAKNYPDYINIYDEGGEYTWN
ncbi:ribosomal-processing cysteine protease Prp [Natranaerobius trueperi]|uniref:Ribosomal processing cysteine protease Prp n=1 Tax=Natranaerobius trueperi TaxID=759412 RepID=A0A226C0E9_9FIRM|nr:ribosomal-processing cysteine protease Prp [Natranaerobius trueperi]OWZ83929.1 cysteine protease [Natranaerobius trueperi]